MSFPSPISYPTDSDGFARPLFGGTLGVKTASVAYTDTTAKDLFELPKGAVIVQWLVNVETAFNDTGTDLLDLGVSGTAEQYASDLDVSSVGQIVTGFVAGQVLQFATPLTAPVTVQAIYTEQNSDASAGLAQVACVYYLSK